LLLGLLIESVFSQIPLEELTDFLIHSVSTLRHVPLLFDYFFLPHNKMIMVI